MYNVISKRVSNALTLQVTQEFVDKHNVKNQNSLWKAHDTYANGDNIQDIIFRNSDGHLIVVNEWTTKSSRYPTKHIYYTYNTFIDWKPDTLTQIKYDDNDDDIHSDGNIF
mgnify:CR=1 FL=1